MEYMFLPLKKFADFEGRARRKEYWMFILFTFIGGFVFGTIDGIISPNGVGMLAMIFQLAVLIPTIAVAVRRMHDVGKSGWYILIPLYNLILVLTEGDKGSNEYGPDPKGNDDSIDSIAKDELV
ncbi:MAG: DUF805 domain-containing protein [Saprospiraceae bacterium]|nr:DUF805 domain-containing protein [Saprospiraceae bacterium]